MSVNVCVCVCARACVSGWVGVLTMVCTTVARSGMVLFINFAEIRESQFFTRKDPRPKPKQTNKQAKNMLRVDTTSESDALRYANIWL